MLCKLILLSTLLFGLSVSAAVRPQLHLQLRHGKKISALSGDPLIKGACAGIGDNVTECESILQSARPDQKADATALSLFTLRYVIRHAENITAGIKKINEVPNVSPLLQSALTDCEEQYDSLDDVIENAAEAVESKSYQDAQNFIVAAVASIELCDSEIDSGTSEQAGADKTDEDYQMAKDLKIYNLFHQNLLCAVLNILTME